MTVLSVALLFFLVIDPMGNIPVYLTVLEGVPPSRQRRVIVRELLIALGALVVFMFLGRHLLTLLQISEPSLSIAGGIILFIIALRMIFPPARHGLEEEIEGEPLVVPLAIPFVAGPSALATALLVMSREPGRWPEWLLALFLAWLASAAIIYASPWLRRLLGRRGLIAIERLMGMILTTLAVQMFMTGLAEFLVL